MTSLNYTGSAKEKILLEKQVGQVQLLPLQLNVFHLKHVREDSKNEATY